LPTKSKHVLPSIGVVSVVVVVVFTLSEKKRIAETFLVFLRARKKFKKTSLLLLSNEKQTFSSAKF
jgi:hypothetical protein